jgi:hypothetical protein
MRRTGPLDQSNPELVLKLLDLPAERRLRDAERLRRACEVPLTRNRHD